MSTETKDTIDIALRLAMVNLAVDESNISENASLVDDLLMDSLDLVELVVAMEDRFRITIEDEDAEKWYTVKDVKGYLSRAVPV
jgi:acyl carrier protein